jgi:hypothetical protein
MKEGNMGNLTKDQRRMNRKHVIDALKQETGSSGGDAAATRVDAYRNDPLGATTVEFAYVGGLTLNRFYIDPTKPNKSERRSLWMNIMKRMGKPNAVDPGGWDGSSDVKKLQAIAEEA